MSPVPPDCNDVAVIDVAVLGEVEVKNDIGNPVPVTITNDVEVDTDDLEACCAAGNVLLAAIDGNTDGIEALLTTIDGHVDGLEACCAASNVLLTAIDGHVDGVEALLLAISLAVADLDANTDGIEALLTAIDGHVDGLEACCTAQTALLTTANEADHLEDDPAGSAFRGTAILGVRNDASATTTSADGDYTQISTDAAGRPKVNVDTEVASAFTHGQNTDIDSGANEQIVAASNPAKHSVIVRSSITNGVGVIYIGGSGVTTANGVPLSAGESISLPIDDANKVYAISSIDNLNLSWVAI